jgi:prepilin-type N-terminal cleavage/methylation domain-containing protein
MSLRKSFTLIEILVAMAIIGILSGMILVFSNNAINNAKDAKMKEDLNQLNKAFSMYNAANGAYPSTNGTTCNVGDPSATGVCATLNAALIPSYYANVPTNPNTDSYYTYQSASGTDYTLSGTLSNTYAYRYSPSSGYITATPVNGACGTAATTYATDANTFSGTMCSAGSGTTNPVSPVFPAAGNSVTWTCDGSNGASSSGNCTAIVSMLTYAKLMLHMDGSNGSTSFVDASSSSHTLTAYGNAQISTAQKKFGTGSLYTTSGYLTPSNITDFNFIHKGTEAWSIATWIMRTSDTNGALLDCSNGASGNGIYITFLSGVPSFEIDGSGRYFVTGTGNPVTLNTWHYVVFSYDPSLASNNYKTYVDGVLNVQANKASSYSTGDITQFKLGENLADNRPFIGYVDEFAIFRGYVLNGTIVPTSAWNQ